MINFSLDGFGELNAMLTDLGGILGKKAARAAAKTAMTAVLAQVEQTSPFSNMPDGIHLQENFKLVLSGRTKKNQKTGDDVFLKASVISLKPVAQYVALVEYGRDEFKQERTSIFGIPTKAFKITIGATTPNGFMRAALRSQAESVVNVFCSELINEINVTVAKQHKKEQARIKAQNKKIGGNQ